jgi:hypothetical protein
MTKAEFAQRYLAWALEMARQEVDHELQMVRSISGISARKALRFLNRLPLERRREALATLVRRFHAPASLNSDDRRLVEEYLASCRLPLDGSSSGVRGFSMALQAGVESLELGEAERVDAEMWSYRQLFDGGLELQTYVRYSHPVLYFHHVRKEGQILQKQISLLSWLGITSQTMWDLAAPDDDQVKQSLCACIDAFRSSLPTLVT